MMSTFFDILKLLDGVKQLILLSWKLEAEKCKEEQEQQEQQQQEQQSDS